MGYVSCIVAPHGPPVDVHNLIDHRLGGISPSPPLQPELLAVKGLSVRSTSLIDGIIMKAGYVASPVHVGVPLAPGIPRPHICPQWRPDPSGVE